MKNLKEILKSETESLKNQFIDFTKNYAINEYNNLVSMTYDEVNEKWGYFDFKWNRYFQSKKSYSIWHKISNMKYLGLEVYVNKAIEEAKNHYEISIEKLVLRIEKKELNIDTLKCTTSHIGRNIETTLTDGKKIVRAFTIIAEGEIQKPHYRYLIK